MRKQGLANYSALLVGACPDRKVTLGETVLSRVRVPIDPAVCNSDVGTWHPGSAAAAKGRVVHPSKPHASWVQYVARQYGVICWECGLSEGKVR